MCEEFALTQLDFTDVDNDVITNIGNIPMPQGTKFVDLANEMPHTFMWESNSFGVFKPCMLRNVPSAVVIGASNNGTPYDVGASDFTIFSLLGLKAHPPHRPK